MVNGVEGEGARVKRTEVFHSVNLAYFAGFYWIAKGFLFSTLLTPLALVKENWKTSDISSAFNSLSQYHHLSKVMKQLILNVISKQVEEKKVISSQHGFTKGKSCLTNMTAFYDGMTGWVDEWRTLDVLYLNFSKASDTVSVTSS